MLHLKVHSHTCVIRSKGLIVAIAASIILLWQFAGLGSPAADKRPGYPETEAGLKQLMDDTLKALSNGKKERAAPLIKSMQLPNSDAWFKKVFGDENGKGLAEDYAKMAKNFEDTLSGVFDDRIKEKQFTVKAWKVVPGEGTGLQEETIAVMKEKVTLYTVQFSVGEGEDGFRLWSWVYNKGGFRLVGKMRMRK